MKKTKLYRSDFLFSKSDFLIGMGSVGNLFGDYYRYNTSPTSAQADNKALISVWGTIGLDFKNALSKFIKSL